MAKGMKSSKGRRVSAKSATRKRAAVPKAGRRPGAAAVKPKRKLASAKRKPALAKPKLKRKPAPAKRRPALAKPKPRAAPARPKPKPAPAVMKPRRTPAPTKGPAPAALERRIQGLEEQLKAREHDRVELARWRQYHSQLQEQVKAKDSVLAFKEKELLDLRRQVEELKAELKKKGISA
jgi:hypothetical protein